MNDSNSNLCKALNQELRKTPSVLVRSLLNNPRKTPSVPVRSLLINPRKTPTVPVRSLLINHGDVEGCQELGSHVPPPFIASKIQQLS